MTVIAVVAGIVGAKIFHIMENWGDFVADPRGMLFSQGGLTFYGGLLFAAVGIIWYVRKHRVNLPIFVDVTLPTVMLAYGIGRIGCHLAGDGDWGIPANVEAKPGFLPDWLWSETYPNNILEYTRPYPNRESIRPQFMNFSWRQAIFAVLWSLRRHPFRAGWLGSLTGAVFWK